MIHRIVPLIAYMSRFTLKAGDVILTGTRKAWGRCSGDELEVGFNGSALTTRVLALFAAFGRQNLHRRARLVIRCTLNWQRRTLR